MKLGILGPLGGILLASLLLGGFVHFTVTDSPWRVLGFVLAVVLFIGSIVLAVRGEKKSFNDRAK